MRRNRRRDGRLSDQQPEISANAEPRHRQCGATSRSRRPVREGANETNNTETNIDSEDPDVGEDEGEDKSPDQNDETIDEQVEPQGTGVYFSRCDDNLTSSC